MSPPVPHDPGWPWGALPTWTAPHNLGPGRQTERKVEEGLEMPGRPCSPRCQPGAAAWADACGGRTPVWW